MSKGTYLRRKQMGLCVLCGGEIEAERIGKTTCLVCINKIADYKRESKAFAKSMGICPRCQKNKLYGDEKNCLECRVKNQERRKKQRELNPDKETIYQQHAHEKRLERYQQRKEQHLCVTCGKPLRKSDTTHSNCDSCRSKIRSKYMISVKPKNEYKQVVWASKGLCTMCGAERYENHGLCKYHYDILKLNGGKNEEWKRDNARVFKRVGELA